MKRDSISTPVEKREEKAFEESLRPPTLHEFIGQKKKVENLRTYIQSARQRHESLDHVLFSGPPGLGKTTLANAIAVEMDVRIKQTSGPVLDKKGDITAVLTDLEPYEILFIDEIHRLKSTLEELLYKAMEDFQIDVVIGQGAGARTVNLDINPFTLVGATTRAGLLSSPLRDRFGINLHLDFYATEEIEAIVRRSARILGIGIEPEAASAIACRSRATPRVANRLLRRLRDFAQVEGKKILDLAVTEKSFLALEVDEAGFDEVDRRLLLTIIEKFAGGPVGISTLAIAVHEEKETIEDVYEPYLMQEGYLKITLRGRLATEKAYRHFRRPLPPGQKNLF